LDANNLRKYAQKAQIGRKMDIKKSDSSIHANPTTAVTRQMGESNNRTHKQTDLLDLKAGALSQIKIGQQLELLVLKLTSNDAILEIMGTKTQVRTTDIEQLQVGQRLKAQITATEPMIQLKVLSPNSEQSNKLQSLINSTLRQIMPTQQPLKNILENIQLLTKVELPANSPLQAIKETFIQSLPPSQAFESADVLPEIFKRSGIFTEHLLQNIITNPTTNIHFPNNDLKIALLRLADKLRSLNLTNPDSSSTNIETRKSNSKMTASLETYSLTSLYQNKKLNDEGNNQQQVKLQTQNNTANTKLPAISYTQEQLIDKLLNHTEGALSRLQTLQLQHLQTSDPQKTSWVFELPIRTDSSLDNINIYIEQDEAGNKTNPYTVPWKVILEFNIKELGAIQAHIMLQGTKVSVNFWVENKSTSSLFSEHLNLLENQLNKAGLATGKLKCQCDKPPPPSKPQQTQLINETL